MNPTPDHLKFLEWKGVDPESVKIAISNHAIYQAAMRCSIRNPEATEPVRMIVPDRSTAVWLQEIFAGSRVNSLGIDFNDKIKINGRPRRYVNDTSRKAENRKRNQLKLKSEIESLSEGFQPCFATPLESKGAFENDFIIHLKSCDESSYKNTYKYTILRFHGSIYGTEYEALPYRHVFDKSVDQFIAFLRVLSKREVQSKDSARLLCPFFFTSDQDDETMRGLENARFASGIWLDIEGGNMTHREFADSFPRLRIVAFNTYNQTKQYPRYRIYIPLTTPVNAEVYSAITHEIRDAIQNLGWKLQKVRANAPNAKAHGIDSSKMGATSLFYLPCQAKDKQASFFRDYNKNRKPMDPVEWVKNSASCSFTNKSPELEARPATPEQQAERELAISAWRATGVMPGHGNSGIFKLSCRLRKTGLHSDELETVLRKEASLASSPGDRQRDVTRLVK